MRVNSDDWLDEPKGAVFIPISEINEEDFQKAQNSMLEYLIGYKAGTYDHFMTQFNIRHPEWQKEE